MLGVEQGVGTGEYLRHAVHGTDDLVVGGAAGARDSDIDSGALEVLARVEERLNCSTSRVGRVVVVHEYAAFVGHYPSEIETGGVDDGFRQFDGGWSRVHAVQAESGVDVNGHFKGHAVCDCGVGQVGYVSRAVDGDSDVGMVGEGA